MSQSAKTAPRRRHLPLSIQVSILLVLAAIIPLLFTVAFSEWQTRPALLARADEAMQSDAKARVQLIDTYFKERLLDAQTLGQVPSVQEFLSTPSDDPSLSIHASYALVAGAYRDKNYSTWAIFDPRGHLRLYYPVAPQAHGKYLIPPEHLQLVAAGKSFVSAVYFNPETGKTSVDIYAPIFATPVNTLLGFMRATLNLDYILNIVNEDRGNNGTGSYAFILDENGVRIADTETAESFKAVAPLSVDVQDRIKSEARYGTSAPVPVLSDAALANRYQHPTTSASDAFQITPTGKSEAFQVVRRSSTVLLWNYFVLSPMSTVTEVANQQLLISSIIALAITILAAILGLILGRGITYPIMNSVEYLRRNSNALLGLATRQKDAASEQTWVVDSSQVGLQSVQYYTDAIQKAANQLHIANVEMLRYWYQIDPQVAAQYLECMAVAAEYIKNAATYQKTSNEKLATALKVATQVTEQLASGAASATEASQQLEQVVERLRQVVGK